MPGMKSHTEQKRSFFPTEAEVNYSNIMTIKKATKSINAFGKKIKVLISAATLKSTFQW